MAGGRRGNALVTGAARRIGRAIALGLSADGWTVGIHCLRSRAEAEGLAAEIAAAGGSAYVAAADLRDDAAVAAMMRRAAGEAGPVTCLVNNASLFEPDDLASVSRDSWDRHMDTDLWAPLLLSRLMVDGLPAGGGGDIVNIVDERVAGLPPGFLSYTVAKAGLWALTRSLALELAPRVRVNAIGPGPTLPSPRQSEAQFRRQAAAVPLGRGASPEEIARGVRYILGSPSMTGQLIMLDGGQHLGWHFPGHRPAEE